MNGRDIELHIEGIALASMPFGGERRLREAVEQELARLARQSGSEWAPRMEPLLAGSARPAREAGPDRGVDSVAARIGRDVDLRLSGRADR